MSMLLVYAEAVPTDVVDVLDMTGFTWKAANNAAAAQRLAPDDGWTGALVLAHDPEAALEFCRETRRGDKPLKPLLLAIKAEFLNHFESNEELYDDFIVLPMRKDELEVRLTRLMWKETGGSRPNLIEYGSLVLNLIDLPSRG